jgi:hypothetical protein
VFGKVRPPCERHVTPPYASRNDSVDADTPGAYSYAGGAYRRGVTMRRFLPLAGLVLLMGWCFIGCDWDTADDDATWDNTFSWVNFSGTYYGSASDGLIVSDYTRSAAGGSGGGATMIAVQEEPGIPASYPSFQAIISGRFPADKLPVVPGSITILMEGANTAGAFTDDGGGALQGGFGLVGQAQTSDGAGTVQYETGVWTLTLDAPGFIESVNCKYSWAYTVNATNSTVVPAGPNSGATSVNLYAFVVRQVGNRLTLTDSTGRTYEGRLTIVGTGGGDGTGSTEGEVLAGFEVRGVSAAGIEVIITGYLQGAYVPPNPQADVDYGFLTQRMISGQWIEVGGKVGDIRGAATSVDFDFVISRNTNTTTRTPRMPTH